MMKTNDYRIIHYSKTKRNIKKRNINDSKKRLPETNYFQLTMNNLTGILLIFSAALLYLY